MYLGYNTNGLAHHDPWEALGLLADLGYRGIALTLDHQLLHPWRSNWEDELARMRTALQQARFRSVIETGARFLLDPRQKHEPTLMSPTVERRARRVEFLCRAIDAAQALGSDCVSFWSGIVRDAISEEQAWARLLTGLREVLDYAAQRNVRVGFEPEPGMFIDSMARFEELVQRLSDPRLELTLDIGHLHCLGEVPIPDYIRRWSLLLVNVHIEDMRAGVHEHLMFGEGELQFRPIIDAFREVGYQGGIYVELSRHSHEGPTAADRSIRYLSQMAPEFRP